MLGSCVVEVYGSEFLSPIEMLAILSEPFFFIVGQPVKGVDVFMPEFLSLVIESMIDTCCSLIVLKPC